MTNPRVPSSPPPPSTPPTVWLIERGQPERQSPTMWWCGNGEWSDDTNKAVRFADRADAERVVAAESSYVGDPIGRVTEHSWMLDFISAVHQDFENGIPRAPATPSSPEAGTTNELLGTPKVVIPAELTEALDEIERGAADPTMRGVEIIRAARSALLALYAKMQAKAEGR